MALSLFKIIVFPGFFFLSTMAFLFEYVDRKLCARMQNRIGPPWYQPIADFFKLVSKETVIPQEADPGIFRAIPIFALSATASAFLYIPIWGQRSVFPFDCDLVVVLYLLTVPTITFFLAGWFSSSLYAEIGSIRAITQLFAYEVPLYMSLLGPALLANTWSISGITAFYRVHPLLSLLNIPGFFIAIIAAQGKLERAPFDLPDAETEIVGGTFTEYSGRFLAIFRMAMDCEMVVLAALISAVFFPALLPADPFLGFLAFLVKVFLIVFLLALMKTAFARFRIDQMISFCWKTLAPVSLLQIVIDIIAKGVLVS